MSRGNWEAFLRTNEPRDPYRDYLREMDRAYRNFRRDRRYLRDLPVSIDLRAYEAAYYYDGQDSTFAETLPELLKFRDDLHPYMRRYLAERFRKKEDYYREVAAKHARLSEQCSSFAAQFEDQTGEPVGLERAEGMNQAEA
jgi:hypothetical protein